MHGNLKTAREKAVAIYRARVDAVDTSAAPGQAWIEVLEVFKGDVKSSSHLVLPAGGGGDCTVPFRAGQEYLLYATGRGPTDISLCSRTRPVADKDAELTWLRTNALPVMPVALQREVVSCDPCDLSLVGGQLIAAKGEPPGEFQWPRLAGETFKAGRPFFTNAESSDLERRVMAGIGSDGKAFELTEERSDFACQRKVFVRSCERLEVSEGRFPSFACAGGGEPKLRCDQRQSRKARWEPVEALQPGACNWMPIDRPSCFLEAPRPLPAGAPQRPVLSCRLSARPGRDGKRHVCTVEPKSIAASAAAAAPGR